MKITDLLTFREATNGPLAGIVTTACVHQYTSRKIFRSVEYNPPPTGPGKGCKVNMADCVTLCLLHGIFSTGIRFESMLPRSASEFNSTQIRFEREIEGAPKLITHDNGEQFRVRREFWVNTTIAENVGWGREIQKFLEEFNFKVWVCISRRRLVGPDTLRGVGDGKPTNAITDVTFFHATESLKADYLDIVGAIMPYKFITFINGEHWLRRIQTNK